MAPDRLRFDFSHAKPVTPEEQAEIEARLNRWILANAAARTEVLDLEAAKASGAVAMFGEKYESRVRVLDGPRLVIGREGGPADLTVPDPEISRQHAAVECYGERVLLRDLDSRNGTFVGRARLGVREVADQTEFRLGGTEFLLIVTERG